ncbi:hypothetical protein CVT26_005148 [Gymnopilus dilepis]|uniref:Uncharacterized protein n=1 Tax=Gymnopilus dilepis TaxID=231916 RepID=A0A409X2V0_9AGAR|nr:hypothetical protein CVT26_005148 [Gymnopilus dilepis]
MNIFRTWDDQIEFTSVAREVARKRNEVLIPTMVPAHSKLQQRTRYLMEWRKQHEQLVVMTGPTKGLGGVGVEFGGMDMEKEVKETYEVIKRIDVLWTFWHQDLDGGRKRVKGVRVSDGKGDHR